MIVLEFISCIFIGAGPAIAIMFWVDKSKRTRSPLWIMLGLFIGVLLMGLYIAKVLCWGE